MTTELIKKQKENFHSKFLGKFAFLAVIRENSHQDQAETAIFEISDLENLYDNGIDKNAEKNFLQEITGKFGIFAKTIIRIKRKPQSSKSATSKP